ncbi:MAG: XRE family transcriptional regulator [Clostridia bacterium]|nr:XRE family transcriptional regulator [Clostridia bacterium]
MDVGQRMRECRIKKGLTVDELAEKLSKNRATVYRYENGDIENLPITILEPIANALGTTPSFLMGWAENSAPLTQTQERTDFVEAKEAYLPTEQELAVLKAYRSQPNMQPAVDRILGISSKHSIRLEGKIAARGFTETAVKETITLSPEEVKKRFDESAEEIDF